MPFARLKKKMLRQTGRAMRQSEKMLRSCLTKGVSRERHINHQHLRTLADKWPDEGALAHVVD